LLLDKARLPLGCEDRVRRLAEIGQEREEDAFA